MVATSNQVSHVASKLARANESPASALTLVGVNYRTAPLALRERLAFTETLLPAALHFVTEMASEAYILSTCNRTELYAVTPIDNPVAVLTEMLAKIRGIPREELGGHTYMRTGEGSVRHLLRVASGLDSMVLGEAQILGQVRDAYDIAMTAGTIGSLLGRVLPLAFEVGKRARTETRIGWGAVSSSSVAVDLARRALGQITQRAVLVVGAGDAAQATVRSLADAGASDIMVVNRSLSRAQEVAEAVGGRAVAYEELTESLRAADIVISSTSSPDPVITEEAVREAMQARPERSLLCVDIAVPRDIDPAVATVPNVHLYNIDHLESLCSENLRNRQREVANVEALVDAGLADFQEWQSVQRLVPTIGALYQHAESIRRMEIDRTIPRLRSLSSDDRELIDVMTASIVRRLLHGPVAALKAHGQDPSSELLARAVRELFALDEPAGAHPQV
jgi:glutamyl-tRNA reductase